MLRDRCRLCYFYVLAYADFVVFFIVDVKKQKAGVEVKAGREPIIVISIISIDVTIHREGRKKNKTKQNTYDDLKKTFFSHSYDIRVNYIEGNL